MAAHRFSKEEVVAETGMVTAGHPLAASVGVDVLRRGGNAVDAVVATAFALAVVEPYMSNLGAVGCLVAYLAERDRTVALDYGMRAPRAARPDVYELEPERGPYGQFGWPFVKDYANSLGYRSIGVPGCVAGLCLALERWGTWSREEVLEPAIELAEQGVPVDWYTLAIVAVSLEALSRFPQSARVFLKEGRFPYVPGGRLSVGERLRQPDLATSLRQIARHGPAVFYAAELGDAIAEHVQANGGLLSREDLRDYSPRVFETALGRQYRGHTLAGVPGPTGCGTVIELLNILEGYDLGALGHASPETLHLITEACRRAYQDTFAYVGDDERVAVPWHGLLSKEYAAACRATIGARRSEPLVPVDPWRFQGEAQREQPLVGRRLGGQTHTSHVCVVDGQRNAVSLTQSLGELFGSKVVVPGTGVTLNNMMICFNPVPGHPDSVDSGKWLGTPMAPMLVFRDGRLLLAAGAPGGRRIPSGVAQTISGVVDHGLGIQAAIAAPMVHDEGAELIADDRLPANVLDELRARGHPVVTEAREPLSWAFAQLNGILVDSHAGLVRGGADPVTLAAAVGYSA